MRGVDLARSAGLSVQQIRNYVDVGLLPPAERAANGYRVFTGRHARALTVARILLDGYGWHTTIAVLSAVHSGDTAGALAAVDRGHAELDHERAAAEALLRTFDQEPPAVLRTSRPLRIGDTAAIAGVRPSALRVWEELGLLAPAREPSTGYRLYDREQLVRARVIAMLRGSGYPLPAAKAVMDAMDQGDSTRTRTALEARLRNLDELSWRRLRAASALFAYLEGEGLRPDAPDRAGRGRDGPIQPPPTKSSEAADLAISTVRAPVAENGSTASRRRGFQA
ncbi:MerR family transcriptional regulator [Polymorphospora sp. NPDC050346]|uniref:MerR family transcriptional regulator n=1 Tax=Polymorphospora sp. NPDC050346 TaxID=3155780 RepID=UPI0033C3C0C8